MRTSRRTKFFAFIAIVSLLMSVPAPAEFRWVAWLAAALATFWVVLMFIEDLSQGAVDVDETDEPAESEAPFRPPPFPGRP